MKKEEARNSKCDSLNEQLKGSLESKAEEIKSLQDNDQEKEKLLVNLKSDIQRKKGIIKK